MDTTILRILRGEARAWWAHRRLRDHGQIAEARIRERASIRSSLETLRSALACPDAYVHQGRGGSSVHYACSTGEGSRSTVSHSSYGRIDSFPVARILIGMGLPFIDTLPVREPHRLIGLPLVAVGRQPDPAPWGAMSYAPLAEYAVRASALGASVINLDPDASARGGDLRGAA